MNSSTDLPLPSGFRGIVANLGVKDSTDDLVIVATDGPVATSGVFTQSRFVGPSVLVSREHIANLQASAVVVISKNANVANGQQGEDDAREVVALTARHVGCEPSDVLIASTGVIGRPYPMENIRAGFADISGESWSAQLGDIARGIMTTDTVEKTSSATIAGSSAVVSGVAKGVGMIEPNMATMIAMILTDADISAEVLESTFSRVTDSTFNCVSIDGDTSTSDTAIIMSSGVVTDVSYDAFESAVMQVCTDLTRQIAADGEGAETLIEVLVDEARDEAQARRVAKSIVNSPLVKTAIHGADPNWGRIAMAVGKVNDDDIDQNNVVIRIGSEELFPQQVSEHELEELSSYLQGDEVLIHVSLGIGSGTARAWGCDLTDGYVRINADYTT
ncbi:MAG: bifunctional glutamate N-acetyltransferase/amino-acid acetyltransferase ArgJ [Actinomycetota bacterium]|nr:bifunctional glutamate N-acetyltransferase/amino-acid acetyltransferase ArgJ [Actinomycetota bacterium]MEC8464176.1 bifunctional glutamate N-acetyltransferase/amino-acid acetyltransferase ArgJ [Actinomycetota bacterium]